MQRDWFVFYKSFLEAWKDLPDNQRLQFYDKILSYGIVWECENMDPLVETLFKLVKPQLDANNKKKEDWDKWWKYWKLWWRPKKNPTGVFVNNPSGDKKITPKDKDKVKDKEKILQLEDLLKQDDSFLKPMKTREEKNTLVDRMVENWDNLERIKISKDYLECLFLMVNCWLHVKKNVEEIYEQVEWIKETARKYGYLSEGWIDKQKLLQVFNTCYTWDSERKHQAYKVKSLFITFLQNNASNK